MRKAAFGIVIGLILLGAFVASAGVASAVHLQAADKAERLMIAPPCVQGITETTFPANTAFYVAHGWGSRGWTDPEEKAPELRRVLMSPATTFELYVDGELQKSILYAPLDKDSGVKGKLFVTEFPDGMTGTRLFEGRWFLDASAFGGEFGEPVLWLQCQLTVEFV